MGTMSISTTVILVVDMAARCFITPILMYTHTYRMATSQFIKYAPTVRIECPCYPVAEDVTLHEYLELTELLHHYHWHS